jgi:hypothetical protein
MVDTQRKTRLGSAPSTSAAASGTDAALALGLTSLIINEELYDKDLDDNWCYGFYELKERAGYPPEKVAEITGVRREKPAIARFIATNKPAYSVGLAVDENPNGVHSATRSVLCALPQLDVPVHHPRAACRSARKWRMETRRNLSPEHRTNVTAPIKICRRSAPPCDPPTGRKPSTPRVPANRPLRWQVQQLQLPCPDLQAQPKRMVRGPQEIESTLSDIHYPDRMALVDVIMPLPTTLKPTA